MFDDSNGVEVSMDADRVSVVQVPVQISEGGGHLVLGILHLIVMSIIARTTGHLGPVLPSTSRPLAHLAFNLHTQYTPLSLSLCGH